MSQQQEEVLTKMLPEMQEQWDEAMEYFDKICRKSLNNCEIKNFEDIEEKIKDMSTSKAQTDGDKKQKQRWTKMKSVSLVSLKCLKILLAAASNVASFFPFPETATHATISALSFVFDIPDAIRSYRDAVNKVFGDVSVALCRFRIYTLMDIIHPFLAQQIHSVLISVVKVCAHVVKYREGSKGDRFMQHVKAILDVDLELAERMKEFNRSLQQQREIEGTVTLSVAMKTRHDIALMNEHTVAIGKTVEETFRITQKTQHGVGKLREDSVVVGKAATETLLVTQQTQQSVEQLVKESAVAGRTATETLQVAQQTQKTVLTLGDGADRMRDLFKIRDTLGVESTVRLDTNTTQTCSGIAAKCLKDTGSWIWKNEAFLAWTAPKEGNEETSRLLLVYGPPNSGKTFASALIIKRFEEQKRTYVAHYFFPPRITSSDDEEDLVFMALKYMAFQIARIDVTLQKVLIKACDKPSTFRHLEDLNDLWKKLRIGASRKNALYYLVFDGIENLPGPQAELLLKLVASLQSAEESSERVRILVSGTEDQFNEWSAAESAYCIKIDDYNTSDMQIFINKALSQQGILQHTEQNSYQQRARDNIFVKLPQKAKGSYSRLQLGLDGVIHLLSKRSAVQDLDEMLDQSMSGHEAVIKNLQQSLTADEINEVNELLKWILFSYDGMTLDQLEAVMFLYSGTESLTPLQYIIKNKYSSILKMDNGYVYCQDDIKDYLKEKGDSPSRPLNPKGDATISMTITINNANQETCAHFLWDLAHEAIRDKFSFNIGGDASNASYSSSWGTIDVDEFEAHHTIVTRAFDYLIKPSLNRNETKEIGKYLIWRLPHHLDRLRQLKDNKMGELESYQYSGIGQNLYKLFSSDEVFVRHKESFEQMWWTVSEMESVQKWLTDSKVIRKLSDNNWRDEIKAATSPARGYLRHFVKALLRRFLKERSWNAYYAHKWIEQLMEADRDQLEGDLELSNTSGGYSKETDWNHLSIWCQSFLGLQDSEIDSLWYERLAEAFQHSQLDTALSLYQYALKQQNPSWLCYRGLGISHHEKGQTKDAITQLELALEMMEQEDAQPKPETKDRDDVYLLLGQYTYETGEMDKAKKYYLLVSNSQGWSGYFKAMLSSRDLKAIKQFLNKTPIQNDLREDMTTALKNIARYPQYQLVISWMLTAANRQPGLLKKIAASIQKAMEAFVPDKGRPYKESEVYDRFFQDETRGVLLCDQGFTQYLNGVSENSPEDINEALRLFRESRKQLSNVGGSKALFTRRRATTALAKHCFQIIVDHKQLNQSCFDALEELAALAKSEPDYNIYHSNSKGFLGMAYVFCEKKELARGILVQRMIQALQILSDGILDNEKHGFVIIQKTSEHYSDFTNAAIALSLFTHSDIVAETLHFDIKDISEADDERRQRILDMVVKLANKTIQAAKDHVPEITKQTQRIEAARAHINSLLSAAGAEAKTETTGDEEDIKAGVCDPVAAHALRLLQSRLSQLNEAQTLGQPRSWGCDGVTAEGAPCEKTADFETDFYHCIYCANQDFCGDCLRRLRDPNSDMAITECSALHKWLHVPRQGDSMYVGPRAKIVRVPSKVKALEDDERILKIYYAEDGSGEEITVEAWKDSLREIWRIPLRVIERNDSKDQGEEELKLMWDE